MKITSLWRKITSFFTNLSPNKIIIAFVIYLVVLIGGYAIYTFTSSSSTSNYATTKSNTCGYCKRTFYPGDSAGNYMNIARSGLCNNCYNNYKRFSN